MAHICVKDIDVMDLDDGCWDGALHCKGGMDVSGWRAPVKRQAGRRIGREEGGGVLAQRVTPTPFCIDPPSAFHPAPRPFGSFLPEKRTSQACS